MMSEFMKAREITGVKLISMFSLLFQLRVFEVRLNFYQRYRANSFPRKCIYSRAYDRAAQLSFSLERNQRLLSREPDLFPHFQEYLFRQHEPVKNRSIHQSLTDDCLKKRNFGRELRIVQRKSTTQHQGPRRGYTRWCITRSAKRC